MINTMIDLLEHSVEKFGQNIAVDDISHEITFSELYVRAKRIAMKFKDIRKEPVIVLCDRSLFNIEVFWGIVLSGNFYVPLDKAIPKLRLIKIVEQIMPKYIVAMDEYIKDEIFSENHIEVVKLRDAHFSEIDEEYLKYVKKGTLDIDPLYMVFTSGTTGMPKGVIKDHRSMLSFGKNFVEIFKINETDILGNQANFDFDVAAKDIYISALTGAKLVIIPNRCFVAPIDLIKLLNDKKITTLIWAVAAIRHIANSGILENTKLTSINKILFSGEVLKGRELNAWQNATKNTMFVNLYAPSEVTGNCLYHIVDNSQENMKIPLGQAFPNVEVFILNSEGREINDGEHGEIYVRGAFLAKGYYNNQEQTKLRFIQNPLHNLYPDIVFRTGDNVYKESGEYYFAGRSDQQIKYRGHRIELNEIEEIIYKSDSDIQQCCIVFDKEEDILALLVQGKEVDALEMYKVLLNVLPKYMIPTKYYTISKVPENARGKIDRLELEKLYKRIKNNH